MKLISFCFCLLCAVNTFAQTAPPKPCPGQPEFRQFDFWVGEWDVKVNGNQAGTNSVQLILDKCVIFENWAGARGMNGKSFNIYNTTKKQWQQFWVDDRGNTLELAGEFKDGVMRMAGARGQAMQRITWTPNADGSVRQLWESSNDSGKTWNVAFDGLYLRKKTAQP